MAEKMEIIAGELPICVCVCAHLAMIQDQALVASKHYLVETKDKNLADNLAGTEDKIEDIYLPIKYF